MKFEFRGGASVILLSVLLVAGCQTTRMQLDDSFSDTDAMEVSGRQGWHLKQRIRFGEYEAHSVRRSFTTGRESREGDALRDTRRRQAYAFSLRNGEEDEWHVECEAALAHSAVDLSLFEVETVNRSSLWCYGTSAQRGSEDFEMELTQRRERPLVGRLWDQYGAIEIVGTNRLVKSLPTAETSGYFLREGDATLGAVEVINRGRVWMSEGLPKGRRSTLAAAAASLLLMDDLREIASN